MRSQTSASAMALLLLVRLPIVTASWLSWISSSKPNSETAYDTKSLDGSGPLQPVLTDQWTSLLQPGNTTEIPAAQSPSGTVFFLHGLASNAEQVLFGIAPLIAERPTLNWVLPNADVRRVTALDYHKVLAWFDMGTRLNNTRGSPLVWSEDESSMLASVERVQGLVNAELSKGVPPERIVLGGFSQGCVISLLVLLSMPTPLGGAFCMSGWLALSEHLQRSPDGSLVLSQPLASRTTPIFWGHGLQDKLVPALWGTYSRLTLSQLGFFDIETHEYQNLEHWYNADEMAALEAWLAGVLPTQT